MTRRATTIQRTCDLADTTCPSSLADRSDWPSFRAADPGDATPPSPVGPVVALHDAAPLVSTGPTPGEVAAEVVAGVLLLAACLLVGFGMIYLLAPPTGFVQPDTMPAWEAR